MTTVTTDGLSSHANETVRIKGWVDSVRDLKSVQFIVLRDRHGKAQAVSVKDSNPELSEKISDLNNESVVSIEGEVKINEDVDLGGLEILLSDLKILSTSAPQIPIQADTGRDQRLDWRFIDLREDKKRLIFTVQTTAEHAMRSFWIENDFIEIHSPKLMGTSSESGAELFTLEYFDQEACLAQSPQFYKQMAMASGFDRVFEIGPVFRANPSFTSRHDTEFTSVDVEMAWIDSHDDVMGLEERWMRHVLKTVKEKHGKQIESLFSTSITVPEVPFPRVTMSEAYEVLERENHKMSPEREGDLDPKGERIVARYVKEKHDHDFVFVTDYPTHVRPFYHMRYENNPDLTKSFDLLWKGLEVTTGAQREHRYEILKKQALNASLDLEDIGFYLDFFKYGCPPHGGFGFGLTRMLMVMLGVSNVREVTYLYRGPKRLHP